MAEEVILSAIRKMDSHLLDIAEMEGQYLAECMKKEVEEIKNELSLILDFLKGSAACSTNKLLNYLIADVVELAHDVQETSDNLWEFPGLLRKLKEWMRQLGGEGGEPPLRSPPDVVGDRNAVGLEKTIDSLLRETILPARERRDDADGPYNCYIQGVAGIGKTTLAKELFNHAAVADRFHCRAWVCVTGIMSRNEILINLMVQVGEGEGLESLEKMDNRSLKQMLRQHLLIKTPYFIVLDDVDDDAYLKSIFETLPKDEGSRLLITSQNHVEKFGFYEYVHSTELLDDDKSWELFLNTAKTSEAEFPRQLKGRARKMLKQCSGLPLAIIEVGRQLARKRESGIEWEELLESPIDLSQTLAALESSYHKLSPSEKSVFMCLSFFEEDATIRIEKLSQIAIMVELINDETEGSFALRELKSKSFVEWNEKVDYTRYPYVTKSLQIRIVFHRLSVARAKDEINFEILRNNGKSPSSRKICHRVIYCSRQKFNYSTNQDEHLVSLFFRGGGYFDASPSYFERFERLVILDVEGFGLKILPNIIGTLFRLKYLGLRNNHIQKLPNSLGFLKRLEVLDIALNFMVEVPDIIWELESLRHLYMSDIIIQGPLKIDALENIETLSYISVDIWTYELSGLQMMNKLRRLGIEGLDGKSDVSKLFKSLAKLECLNILTLRGFRFKRMPLLEEISALHGLIELKLVGLLTRLPSAENFPREVRFVTLINSSLDEDPMLVLEKLPRLIELTLQNAYTGQQMTISHDGFEYLDFLVIKEFWHLRDLQVGELALRHLHRIEISDCPYLHRLHLNHCKFLKDRPEIKSQLKKYEIV